MQNCKNLKLLNVYKYCLDYLYFKVYFYQIYRKILNFQIKKWFVDNKNTYTLNSSLNSHAPKKR